MIILAVVTIKYLIDHQMIMKTVASTEKYASEQEREGKLFNDIYDTIENTLQNIENGTFGGGGENSPKEEKPKQDGTWDAEKKVNTPKIEGTGLIAVYYDESAGTWVDLTKNSTKEEWAKWYDYADTSVEGKENTSKWANARTKDGSMWVWIPRYEYKIDQANKSIDVRFISVDTKKGSTGYTTDSTGITRSSDEYIIHPAFIDDTATTYNNGGWDKEISGFWVAKYQAGYQNGTVGEDNTKTVENSGLRYTTVDSAYPSNYLQSSIVVNSAYSTDITLPVFKANTYAYNIISTGDMYLLGQRIGQANMYGLSNVDSHLEKNSEWGAVAYLTHSKYGLNANTSNNKEVEINNKNLRNTIKTLGASTDGNVYGITSYGDGNTPNDVNASSNKNMTGIFDLSGCLWDCTTGFYKGGSASNYRFHSAMASSSTKASTKYVTLYEANNKVGDATNETSGWNSDYAYFVTSSTPIMSRGANCDNVSIAGIFTFTMYNGDMDPNSGFRVCLVPMGT